MPQAPLRPCRNPACPNLVRGGGHCPTCEPKHGRQAYDRERGSAASRGYGRTWQKVSRAYLREHPFCECDECRRRPCPLPSEVVDHKVPHRGDPGLFWDQSNWQALAKTCHDRKTALEDSTFVRRRG